MDSNVCNKSHDNQHVYKKTVAHLGSTCIYCGEPEEKTNADDPTSRGYMGDKEKAAGIKTGDAILNEIPGNEKVKIKQAPKCPGKPPLDELSIMALTGAFEMYGRIMAIQARIDGMKAGNAFCAVNNMLPQYRQEDFAKAGDNITLCVQQLNLMKTVNVVK